MEVTPYTIPLWTVTAVGSGLAVLTLRFRHKAGAYPLFGVFAGAVIWAGAYAMELSAGGLDEAVFWHNVRFVGSNLVPVSIFVLALQFAGRRHLVTRRNLAALLAVPVLTVVIVWTNPIHGLWATFAFDPDPSPAVRLHADWGLWFPVFTFVAFGAAFGAVALFAEQALAQGDWPLVSTAGVFLLATILPTGGAFLYVVGLTDLDLGPFAFVISGLLIMGAMFKR